MNFSIPEQNFEGLEKKLNKIRNKCAKYGCEFKFERLGEHIEEKTYFEYDDSVYGEPRVIGKYNVNVKFIDIDVEGVAKVNGWQFAASLEYTSKGNIIKAVPGIEIPERFYNCEPWCEHCKTARDRRYSFVVFKEESGEFKQVGKACLKDFTGGLSAEAVANFESFFKEIEEAKECIGYGNGRTYYKVSDYLACCAESIRLFGFVKNGGLAVSTSDRAEAMYRYENNMRCSKFDEKIIDECKTRGFNSRREENVKLAESVAKWAVENELNSNYHHNLKVACSLEYSGRRDLGLLASVFPAYDRNLEVEAEKAEREARALAEPEKSGYVGEIGKRVSFVPKEVKCVTSWKTMYGYTSIYKMTDVDGNVFTWKTSGDIYENDQRVAVKITGTVKEHKEYRGVKQTELTRCKVEYGKREERKPTEEELERAAQGEKEINEALEMLCSA